MDNTTNSASEGAVSNVMVGADSGSPTPAESTSPRAEKKKRRIPKKKMDVAEVVVHFSEERVGDLKEKLDVRRSEVENAQKVVQNAQKNLRTLESVQENLQQKYDELTQASRAELVDKYRKIVTLLKQHPMVNKFAVDRKKRIVVTTNPIFIKKDDWPEAKEAGMYQIRIDFSASNIHDGINILNITRRFSSYDSPTVNNTRPCWGGVFVKDVERDFSTQDLYELITDLIDYISSPNDSAGFTRWEDFFEKNEELPKGYSFFKFDQEKKLREMDDLTVRTDGLVTVAQGQARTIRQLQTDADLLRASIASELTAGVPAGAGGGGAPGTGGGAGATSSIEWRYISDYETTNATTAYSDPRFHNMMRRIDTNMSRSRISDEDYRIIDGLREIGFNEHAAYYLMRLIREDESETMRIGGARAETFELRAQPGGQLELFVHFVVYEPLSPMTVGESPVYEMNRSTYGNTMRYFANIRDLNNERMRQIEREHIFRVRLPYGYWLTRTRERIEQQMHDEATRESIMAASSSPDEYRARVSAEERARLEQAIGQGEQVVRRTTVSERVPATSEIDFSEIQREDIEGGPQVEVPNTNSES